MTEWAFFNIMKYCTNKNHGFLRLYSVEGILG